MGILDCFPAGWNPRQVQVDVLREIERLWNMTDVFAVNVPVAGGKSLIADTLARFAKRAAIITPSRILVEQYLRDFPKLPHLKAQGDYLCDDCAAIGASSCIEGAHTRAEMVHAAAIAANGGKRRGAGRKPKAVYGKRCIYPVHVRRSRVVPYLVCNYHVYLAHRLYRDVLIADEAHNLIPFIQEMNGSNIWKHKDNWPDSIRSASDLLDWAQRTRRPHIVEALTAFPPRYVFERTKDLYGGETRGHVEDVIKLKPIDIRDAPPTLWPSAHVRKVILLSATIGRKDVESLGLGKERGNRVTYVEARSPIPVERRPIILDYVGNVSYRNQDSLVPVIAERIRAVRQHHAPANGVVHLTYGLAAKLRPILNDSGIIWHGSNDRSDRYAEFLAAPAGSGTVLMACGLYEGIDLKGELGEWQILTKVPWPSLADAAIEYRANADEESYAWDAAKLVLQFSGRICRTPTDYGISYIIDGSFERLKRIAGHLFPTWFKESLQ